MKCVKSVGKKGVVAPKTTKYLEHLIACKRTHIRNEQERLRELESLLDEVRS